MWIHIKKLKTDVSGSGVVLLKPVKLWYLLFSNVKPTEQDSDWITWGLDGPRSLSVLFRLDTVLRVFTSFCYEKTSMEFWVSIAWQYFISTKPLLSAGGGGGKERSKWKMEDKYQDKWILSQTFLSITKLHKTSTYFSWSWSVNSYNKVYLSAGK